KRFAKGIRHLGKNFFRIRKEHLPHKDTSELVEFYYFWKKSPAANNSRPQYRRHRRPLKRQSPRNNQPDNEASSGSESEEESEESDGSRDVASCQRCFTTNSKDWHSSKDGEVLCSKCSVSFKKYGEESGVESPPPSSSPRQRLFKPVPEDEETTPSKHNMRTRRSNNTASTNGKQKERNSVSSPDLESTPAIASCSNTISTTTNISSSKSSRKSPSSLPDRDSRKSAQKEKSDSSQAKKRRTANEDDSKLAKKKKEPSDSESGTESSSVSGTEDLGNEADSDDNIQEDLSSSSRPSSPSSVERGFKPLQPHPLTPGAHPVTPAAGTPVNVTSSSQDIAVSSPVFCGPSSVPTQSSTTVISGQPVPTSQAHQQLSSLTVLPASASSETLAIPPPSLSPLSALAASNSSGNLHLRLPQQASPIPALKPSFGLPGHISSVGSKPGSHASNLVSNSCSLSSPLVIPTPSRASSTGTFIPHAELPLPANSLGISANINSPVTAVVKTTVALTSVDSFLSTSASSSSRLPLGGQANTATSSAIVNTSSASSGCKMQDQSEEQDKKPIVPPPGSFLPPPGAVGVPFAPYHSYYYPHSGATHISHFHPSVGMSVSSAAGGIPPPPVPSLVPIKKEPHSPPPPLKSADKATDLSSSSSTALLHPLHRSHPEKSAKLPHGFSQTGLTTTAPPPLTVIEHRDGSKPGEASKPDLYSKDSTRGHSSSPLRTDTHPAPGLHRESRLDSNLSVLRESREIGLVGGATSSQPGQQLPLLSSIKEEPRTLPAAFQPYSHHPSPSVSSSLTSHHPPSSVLQVPQPSLSSDQPLGQSMISQSMMSDSSLVTSRSAPSLDIDSVKIEQNVEDEIDIEDEDDDSRSGSTTPGPTPTVCNREIYKSNSAIFVKVFDRGDRNQCSRTDFIFRPLPDSNLAKKREDRVRKSSHSSSIKEEKKRVETPPRATSASEGQKSSSGSSSLSSSSNSSSNHPPHGMGIGGGYAERHTPRSFADMPALRQLHEYARPHVYAASLDDISLLRFTGQDLTRPPYSLGALQHHPHMDPLMGYRLGGMYPPGSRERLEMELERDKRERDAREREMRERELRDLELREKMKQDMELKPGLERLLPPGAASQLTDPSWLDLQRRMGFPPGAGGHLLPHGAPSVSAAGAHLPGVYPPVSLASDLLSRERDKLDRLDGAALSPNSASSSTSEQLTSRMVYQYYSQRLTSEQHVFMQRAVNECYLRTKPETRPIVDPNHLIYQFSRADPLASGPIGSLPASSTNPLSILPPGMSHHPLFAAAGSREELLQRELYSRGGHFLDPALAHQLSAQAAAHEALQRHMAMERERYGSSGHLPH
ncbi:unnamed protein product, partial [Candidula unifasciata]